MSKRGDHPNPNAFTLRPVKAGDEYVRSVGGGVVRGKAPLDGLVVVLEDREVFIPDAAIDAARDAAGTAAADGTAAPGQRGRR